jgi:DNA gyrase subunit B
VDVALRWGTGYDTAERSFVNVISTPHGGTHVLGFEQGLAKVVRAQVAANARRLKLSGRDGSERIEKDDMMAGLTAVVTVRLPEPQFEGQTKEVLGTGPVRGIVSKVVETELAKILESTRGATKAQATAVLEKIVNEMQARVSARKQKEITRRRNSPTAAPTTLRRANCSSSRATARSAQPNSPAARTSRRSCLSGARSSTSRRRR